MASNPLPVDTDGNPLTTNRKALLVNLEDRIYGTFAEIGAGQEVARHFFQAGHASGTVAKTMSAYDMKFSDAIYGKATRYVSRDRLAAMLSHEYVLLLERLQQVRGDRTCFFVFADTVTTKSRSHDGHGWMGIRYQLQPQSPPNDIILHVRMWDRDAVSQQHALGVVGVNLVYAAFHYASDPHRLVESLVDFVGSDRVEIDMITLSGPDFAGVDNRLLALRLVQAGLTNAVLFSPAGEVLQPSEYFWQRPIVAERGSFRPVTHVNLDMLECATAQFVQEGDVKGKDPAVVMEITIHNLLATGELDTSDFLARVDTLGALGLPVLISNYSEYYRLVAYFRRFSRERIGLALGVNTLVEVFNEKYYENLEGGILEAFGRLFRAAVKLYVYPMRKDAFERYRGGPEAAGRGARAGAAEDFSAGVLITGRNLQVSTSLANLYLHLLENRYIECIKGYDERLLTVLSRDLLGKIKSGDPAWVEFVPGPAAAMIRERGLFGAAPTLATPAAPPAA